ncbi:predicted protein [Aspergillus nidulans FGSC A4]|uniref:Uncharacterized protein n=1 Tax=Emericella nidulans (strain FGSC A4 / ATCC 38163 / CBS 112.46 / NRRL 194 / M139) TaxID=227321 RepID=Q5B9D6_EMENI|nr:hypothetical protein [Aspergillus nidulans FGSC A4]EAA63415.1 predicted protein [Aspergillus nidulans FGSC A4]CBF83888.1 TPA: conserved hypothetical protein [Aspergillus nidulans FGSC A4]|eukprot:XP_660448.1 predicted protein [Aspergillus nidulans FGSC A4]
MKFTGLVASFAVASTATAAAVPGLNTVKLNSTVAQLDKVLDHVDGAILGPDTQEVLADTKNGTVIVNHANKSHANCPELVGIRNLLSDVLGGVVDLVGNTGIVQDVVHLAGNVVSSVVDVVQPVVNVDGIVSNVGDLAHSLVDRIQSGEVDAAGLENLLTALGGSAGLSNLNHVIAEAA